MENYGLDIHGEMLLEQYRSQQHLYMKLQSVVQEKLETLIRQNNVVINSMEFRIKEESSFVGKLLRKGSKYHSLSDITDVFGARIITFYNEDVDRIAAITETLFIIDWPNSVDKRKMHEFDSFGYNSLHYICTIPKSLYYDPEYPELNTIRFEIQMRTALQHVWSAIQHYIGYKSEIETPQEYHRSLSRLAGMLELADNEFSRIRTSVNDYRRRIQSLIETGHLRELPLDGDTFNKYISMHPFDKLNRKIAAINQAEIQSAPFYPYLTVLRQLPMHTLGDVERMMHTNFDDAYQLAVSLLSSTDIDILSETVGLQNLCIVYILKNGKGKPGLVQMLNAINGNNPQNESLASIIMDEAKRLAFMNK